MPIFISFVRMTRCCPTNSVFLPCESKEYKPIVLSGPPAYNPKVKIHDWQWLSLTEPRDNEIGSSRRSTYKRLGTDDDPTGISVTRAMTEQVHTAGDYVEEIRHRSLVNFYSFPLTETEECKNALQFTDLELPKPDEPADYRTTLKDDYPWHYRSTSQPARITETTDKPWLFYRRTLGYGSHDLERIPGVRKFLDDNMDLQNRAAALKIQRFVSYNPFSGEYTDPTKFCAIVLNNSTNQLG